MNKINKKFLIIYVIFTLLFIATTVGYHTLYVPCEEKVRISEVEKISFTDFLTYFENDDIDIVYFSSTETDLVFTSKDGNYHITNNPKYDGFEYDLLQQGFIIEQYTNLETAEKVENSRKDAYIFVYILFGVASCYFIYKIFKSNEEDRTYIFKKKERVAQGVSRNSSFSKSNNSSAKNADIKLFSDIAGLHEVKKDMQCLVDFLVDNKKYVDAGAKLPKGVILYGPPGTGKTLLAKAVAGEANIPFLYMSGSEFVEMYVGVGAKRVRELFDKARKQAPCIVFIDEIDAIGGHRHAEQNGEDRKTLNALLAEMDGFKASDNIMVIAATNRLEDLDFALTRPGRFTDKFCVPVPETLSERLEVINIYIKNKKIADTLDLKLLAKEMVGFSPAKIEALLNEAAIISVQDKKDYIDKEIIDKAMFKVLLQGHAKENQDERDKKELELVAWHEAGHVVVGKTFGKDITKVTIVSSTSGAGGVTFSTPTKTALLSQDDMKHEIMELYGGRLAEYLYFDEDKTKVTTGASNDIERATKIIKDFVTKYGMSDDFGLLNLEQSEFDKKQIVDCEVKLAKELESKTYELLKEKYDILKNIALSLIENETLYADEINAFF